MKKIVLAGLVMFAFVRLAVALPEAAATTNAEITGRYFETCACQVSCPCAANATLPTEGHCDAISLIHIDKGSYGKVKLDGLNLAIVFRSPHGKKVKDAFAKGEMDLFTLYMDDKADATQKEVMPKVITTLFGTQEMKGAQPPQWAAMSLVTEGDSARFQIDGGKKLSFVIENIDVGEKTKAAYKEGDLGNRIVLTNSAPFRWVHDITQGISKTFKYADFGRSWEYKERNAFFGAVSFKQ